MNEWEKNRLRKMMREDNFEKIHDEVKQQLVQGIRWRGIYERRKDPECFTHNDLGLRRVEEIGVHRDGAYGFDIQKKMDKLEFSAKSNQNNKMNKAKNFLNNLLGRTFYGYAWLRKKLSMPVESPMMRPAYARWFNQILGFINPGGLAWCKEGTYTVSTPLQQPSYVALKGAGWATILKAADSLNDNILENKNPTTGDQDSLDAQFKIDGNKSNNTSGNGIHFSWCGRSTVRDLLIADVEDDAIYWEKGVADSGFYGMNEISNTILYHASGRCMYLNGPCDDRIYSVEALQSGSSLDAILINNCGDDHLFAVRTNYGARNGLTISGCNRMLIEQLWSCYNQNHGLQIGGTGTDCNGVTVIGGQFKNNSQSGAGSYDGILVWDSKHVILEGNRCFDNQGSKTQRYGIQSDESAADKTDFVMVVGNDCDVNQDASYDIYIVEPGAADDREVAHNLGRVYTS